MSQFVTDQMVSDAIERMTNDFDSHDIIKDLMTHHPQEYVRDLYTHVEHQDPIMTYHASLGRRLANSERLERSDRGDSPNVRGRASENQRWRKKK